MEQTAKISPGESGDDEGQVSGGEFVRKSKLNTKNNGQRHYAKRLHTRDPASAGEGGCDSGREGAIQAADARGGKGGRRVQRPTPTALSLRQPGPLPHA